MGEQRGGTRLAWCVLYAERMTNKLIISLFYVMELKLSLVLPTEKLKYKYDSSHTQKKGENQTVSETRVTVRLPTAQLEKFDEKVRIRGYKNRSEALRDIMRHFTEGVLTPPTVHRGR